MNQLLEICRCGHDIATHFSHEGKRLTCLGLACDCRAYVDRDAPKSAPVTRRSPFVGNGGRPHIDRACRCKACLDWLQGDYS